MGKEALLLWIKLPVDFYDSTRIKRLRRISDSCIIVYQKLLITAAKSGGRVVYDWLHGSTDFNELCEVIADDISEDSETTGLTLSYLLQHDLAVQLDNGFMFEYGCSMAGSETTAAERMRSYRERKKQAERNVDSNAGEQQRNESEQRYANVTQAANNVTGDRDIDIYRDIDNIGSAKAQPKKPKSIDIDALCSSMPAPLLEAFKNWLRYKTEMRQAYKPQGLQALIANVNNNAAQYGADAVIAVINESMANNYRGILFDRLGRGKPQQPQRKYTTAADYDASKAVTIPADFDEILSKI